MSIKIIDVLGKNFALKNVTKRINGVEVEIKGYVDADTMGDIVQTVALTCFQNGDYRAEFREIASRYAIIKYLTNIEVDDSDIAEIFKMSQSGNWYGEIIREVNKLQVWGEIDLAIDRQIDYLLSTQPNGFDKLCEELSANIGVDSTKNLAEVKEILDNLNKVDKNAFVEAVTENVVKKTKKK